MIAALAAIAVGLRARSDDLAKTLANERQFLDSNQHLAYTTPAGIDVDGRTIDGDVPKDPDRVVAFVVRMASLHDDVRVWNEVARIVEGRDDIDLIGYCDTPACSDALSRRDRPVVLFTILQSGPAVSIQAVQNADEQGASLVLAGSQPFQARQVRWRTGETAATIARSLLE